MILSMAAGNSFKSAVGPYYLDIRAKNRKNHLLRTVDNSHGDYKIKCYKRNVSSHGKIA